MTARGRWARWAAAAALGLLLLPLACSEGGDGTQGRSGGAPGADSAAPDFTLPALSGERVSLRSLRGQIVFIDFWATWCAPCVYQIPVLNEFYDEHRDDGVVVLGISVDAEGRQVVESFAAEHDIRYPVLLGSEGLARRYGAPGFPSLVVVGPSGTIESMHVGLVEREFLERAVRELREAQPAAAGKPPA